MKKKIFQRMLAVSSIVIALVFVFTLLITVFGGIKNVDLDNKVVQGLFIALGLIYIGLAGGTLASIFSDNDAIKEIILSSNKESTTKATLPVLRNLTRKTLKNIEGVKFRKLALFTNEYGSRLKVVVKIQNQDINEVCLKMKNMLEEVFEKTFAYRFAAIDFKVVSLKSDFEPDIISANEKAIKELETQKKQLEAKRVLEEKEIEAKNLKEAEKVASATINVEKKILQFNKVIKEAENLVSQNEKTKELSNDKEAENNTENKSSENNEVDTDEKIKNDKAETETK